MVRHFFATTTNALLLGTCLSYLGNPSMALASNDDSASPASLKLAQETRENVQSTSHYSDKKDDEASESDNAASSPQDSAKEQTDAEVTEATDAQSHDAEDKNLSYDGSDLIEWINSNGGFVHPNVRIGLDPTGQYRGVFAKDEGKGIEDDEIICKIPWDLIVKPKNYAFDRYWDCEAIRELHRQMILGDQSKYAPYINYLKNQPAGRIPGEWSPAGKTLLRQILGQIESQSKVGPLPPIPFGDHGFESVWLEDCKGEDTPLARQAFYQFTSRDEDTLMVPFYDMHNHSNDPKKLNTISSKPRVKGKPFTLRATRDILQGEQIFITYTRCNRCWYDETYKDCTTWSHYSTSDVFHIFGFVEQFPQTWVFPIPDDEDEEDWEDWDDDDEIVFCMERKDETGELLLTFGDNYRRDVAPNEEGMEFLEHQLKRLNDLATAIKDDAELKASMLSYEWDMAWRYQEALTTAISAAIVAANQAVPGRKVVEDIVEDDEDDSGDGDAEDDFEYGDEDSSEDDEEEQGSDEL